MPRPHIAMLWVEGPLSFIEQLCAKSFVDAGHAVTLYHYGPVTGVPEGVELIHGDAILARDEFITHGRTGSLALFSDVFRYHLLAKLGNTIWADTDAYCLRPFETATGHYFGWESESHINGGVLGLPQGSPALKGLLEMTRDEHGVPFWYGDEARAKLEARRSSGDPVHVGDMPWGVWGPHAVTAWLKRTGEDAHAFPREVLYPVPFESRRHLVKARKRAEAEAWITDRSTSIHLYGRRLREFVAKRMDGLPEEGGLLHALLERHGIDPAAAPVVSKRESAAA